MKKILLLSLIALVFVSVVSAQVTVTVSATVKMIVPLTVTKTSDLDFGALTFTQNYISNQSIYLDPLQVATPAYIGFIPIGTDAPHIAQLIISGSPNASISITSSTPSGNPRVYAYNTNPLYPGAALEVNLECAIGGVSESINQQFSTSLDATGNQKISVGGSVVSGVSGNTEGLYAIANAATFTINYN